jgi:hypothetical protein
MPATPETLVDQLNAGTAYDPYSVITRGMGSANIMDQGRILERDLPEFLRQESAARQSLLTQEARGKRRMAEETTKVEETTAAEKARQLEEYQQSVKPRPLFSPTKFDPEAAGKSATLTALVGAIASSVSARAALRSMEGFTRGARQGREDMYNKELKQYEQDLKGWEDNLKLARQKLTDGLDLLSTNRGAALAKIKELDPLLQDGYALTKARTGDFAGALKIIDKGISAVQQAKVEAFKAAQKGDGAAIRMTAEPLKAFREAEYGFDKAIKIEEKLANPEVRKKLDSSGYLRLLLESPREMTSVQKFINQTAFRQLPKEAQELVVDLADMRNAYYKGISGSAVTGSEAARNFFAVVQPSDNSSEILLKLKNIKSGHARVLENTITDYETPAATKERIRALLSRMPQAQPQAGAGQPQDIKATDIERFGAYDPNKYNYGFENGRFYRELK